MDASSCDWSTVTPEWERQRERIEATKVELTERLLAGLAPLTGRRVLELGAGVGDLAAKLAGEVGPEGSVLASDVADGMVKALGDRLAGTGNTSVTQLDAGEIALDDASVDTVVFRMGLMLVADPDEALREIRRVLRPGGRFGATVWGAPQDNPWLASMGMAAMMHGLLGPGVSPVGPGGPFSLADPDALAQRVRAAGFAEVTVEPVSSVRHFRDADEHFEMVSVLAPPIAAAVAAASEDQLAAVRGTIVDLTRQYADDDGLHLPVRALVCVARA